MTNLDRAEAILAARHHKDQMEGDGAVGCFDAAAAVEELREAGLLAPDLPPITVDDLDRPSVTVGPASPGDARDTRMGRILLEEDGLISTTGVPNPYRSIDQARAHALAILAMCNHAEGEPDAVD